MSNFTPNEIVAIDDRDPPWINNKIKSLIKNKSEYFKNCDKPSNPESIRHFEHMQDTLQDNSHSLENLQLIKSILNFTGPY